MISLEAVETGANPSRQESARALFRRYGEFLRTTQSCGYFSYPRFEEEIVALPHPYSDHRGELLLAVVDDAVAGCIAYRESAHESEASGEIKRLFVLPEFRARGIARLLVSTALTGLHTRGFKHVILDTDLATMPGALKLYTSFGFKEYGTRKGSIAFFELLLS